MTVFRGLSILTFFLYANACGNIQSISEKYKNVEVIASQADLKIERIEDGIEINPIEQPAPDTSKSVEERDIGGLGIHLVRKCMDYFNYERENNINKVVMVKNIGQKIT